MWFCNHIGYRGIMILCELSLCNSLVHFVCGFVFTLVTGVSWFFASCLQMGFVITLVTRVSQFYMDRLYMFLAGNQLYELKTHRWGCGWWGPKKSIAIFGYKQWLLSLDMKTKVVHHVEREWMREWKFWKYWKYWKTESVWLLSINMKTKVVQHVQRDWMRDWQSERLTVWEYESRMR